MSYIKVVMIPQNSDPPQSEIMHKSLGWQLDIVAESNVFKISSVRMAEKSQQKFRQ